VSDKKISLPLELKIKGKRERLIAKPEWKTLLISGVISESDCEVNTKGAFFNVKYVRK
jgi:hypothetical protein